MTSVLHVLQHLHSLKFGGIGIWMMDVLRNKPSNLQVDFYLEKQENNAFEDEARQLGASLFFNDDLNSTQKIQREFGFFSCDNKLKAILETKKYQVFHTHHSLTKGASVLKLAAEIGIPVRVIQCHTSFFSENSTSGKLFLSPKYWNFLFYKRRMIDRFATDITACSQDAGRFFMPRLWGKDARCQAVYCGISVDKFKKNSDPILRRERRRKYGLAEDALVIGHAGRINSKVKNHFFMLKIMKELARRNQKYVLFCAGDGKLRSKLLKDAETMGIADCVRFPGFCDVAELIPNCFDVHLLPSLFEGFSIIGIEAVAGGLYTVCSDVVPLDACRQFSDRVLALSLNAPAAIWADAVEQGIEKKISLEEGLRRFEQSPFTIQKSVESLINLYESSLFRAKTADCR